MHELRCVRGKMSAEDHYAAGNSGFIEKKFRRMGVKYIILRNFFIVKKRIFILFFLFYSKVHA